jgi:hypothetical protein
VPGPTGVGDLSRYVLIVEEASDGRVTHSWKLLRDFDLTMYPRQVHVDGFHGRLEQVVFTDQDCHQQYEVCVPTCLASTRIFQVDVVGASGGAALVFVPAVLMASSGNPLGVESTLETS